MARYTAQKEFLYSPNTEFINIIADTGTLLTLEVWNGNAWVASSSSPLSLDSSINVAGLKIRLTPDVGGYFVNDDGEDL